MKLCLSNSLIILNLKVFSPPPKPSLDSHFQARLGTIDTKITQRARSRQSNRKIGDLELCKQSNATSVDVIVYSWHVLFCYSAVDTRTWQHIAMSKGLIRINLH